MKLSSFLRQFLSGSLAFIPHVNRRPWRSRKLKDRSSLSLDGVWDFAYFTTIAEADEFFSLDEKQYLSVSKNLNFENLTWPAHWELHGYGRPAYINENYTWTNEKHLVCPPHIPEDSIALGVYRKNIAAAAILNACAGKTVLALDGFEAAVWVFFDGNFIGYSNQGKNRNEFILPDTAGENTEHELMIIISSLSSGSFLECQDMWRMAGPIRSISLFKINNVELLDFAVYTRLTEGSSSELYIEAKVQNHASTIAPAQYVIAELWQGERCLSRGKSFTGSLSYRFQEKKFAETPEPVEAGTIAAAYLKLSDLQVEYWHPESPSLYTVKVSLVDDEVFEAEIGFRDLRVADNGALLLNFKPIKIHGVNRHDFHPERGRALTEDDVYQDLCLMKANNINAVRCAHYPQHDAVYAWADRLGLLVMDEANMESHALSYRRNILPGNDPRWYAMSFDRVSAMYATHKNHPSIFSWSIGNEIGWGENVSAMAAWLRSQEDQRLIHKRQMNSIADFNSENYGRPEFFERFASTPDNKSFLSTEYAHAMGNAMGDFARYQAVFNAHPALLGGFVWEWCDHALVRPGTKDEFCYGGDFGETFHDGNFCIDGVTTALRETTDKLLELRKGYAYFYCTILRFDADGAEVELQNRLSFTNTKTLSLAYRLEANGKVLHTVMASAPVVEPGKSERMRFKWPSKLDAPATEYLLTVLLVKENGSAKHEFFDLLTRNSAELCSVQANFLIKPEKIETLHSNALVRSNEDRLELVFGRFLLSANAKTGGNIDVLVVDDFKTAGSKTKASQADKLIQGLDVSIYRAPTDNDRRSTDFLGECKSDKETDAFCGWKDAGFDDFNSELLEVRMENPHTVYLKRKILCRQNSNFVFEQRFSEENGRLLLDNSFQFIEGIPLPRIGLKGKIDLDYTEAQWYGRGPGENYPDRNSACLLGVYSSATVDLFNAKYLRPQENGSRGGTRWLLLANKNSRRNLAVESSAAFAFSLQGHSCSVLEHTKHVAELPARTEHYLYLDYKVAGLGNRSCGPETAERYKLRSAEYKWSFYISASVEADVWADSWQWPANMSEDDVACDFGFREGGTDFREQIKSRAGTEMYRDPSDPDVRKARGF